MALELPAESGDEQIVQTVRLPAPTAWPIVLAFGITLVFAGLVTTASVSILGAILAASGFVGWFRDVLPYEQEEEVRAVPGVPPAVTRHPHVRRLDSQAHELHRARLPLEIYPVSAGVKGGLAGGVAMAVLAVAYGIVVQHSIWYPINLLATGFLPGSAATTAALDAFHWDSFIIASLIHLITSLLVGLLYGAMLPMIPRHPILLGGVIAPVLWTGLIHGVIDYINPLLNQRIDWLWFVVSQIGFGLVAGLVVSSHHRIATWQHLPFLIRAGIEAPGVMPDRNDEGPRR